MPVDFLPKSQQLLLAWGANYNDKAGISPATYGLTAEQGAEIVQRFAEFQDAMTDWMNPSTRTPDVRTRKDEARKSFEAIARETVGIIQRNPATTPEMRTTLRITPRGNVPTPAPVPADAPEVKVASVKGRLFNLELRQPGSTRRGRPPKIGMAWLYTYIGEDMPAFEQLKFYGSATRTNTQIVLPSDVPTGAKVWISACWVNTAGRPGPASLPIASWTNHGPLQQQAA